MKKKTEKIIVYRTMLPLVFVASAALALSSCAPVVGPVPGPSAGKGIVNIDLSVAAPAGEGGNASIAVLRTLIPGTVAFDAYELVFTVVQGESGTAETFTGVTSLTVSLDAGTYNLTLTAKKDGNTAATGVYEGITVTNNNETPVTVPIVFEPGAGNGKLVFSITRPSNFALSGATFELTPLHGGDSYETGWLVALYTKYPDKEIPTTQSSQEGGETIASGYYLAVVTLSTGERKAVKSDIVHIGAEQATALEWTFEVEDFHSAIEEVWLVGDMKKDGENWDPQGVEMTKAQDGTFTWEGMINANERFRFHLTDVSTFEPGPEGDGKWYGDWFSSASDGAPGDGGYNPDITLDTATTMYFYSGTTNGNWKITAAGYYRITVNPYAKTLRVTELPVVTGVTINGGDVSLAKGSGKTFEATVQGTGSPSQDVTWAISGQAHQDTTIGETSGTLSIAAEETAGSITVTATSTADPSKSGTVTVTVTSAETPTVTNVSVTTAGDVSEVDKGATLDFNAIVTVTNGAEKTVAWTVTNEDDSPVSDTTNTTITQKASANSGFDVSATLTIADADRGKTLKVTAASTVSGFTNVTGSATVFARKYGNVYLIGDEFGNWTDTGTVEMTYAGLGVYTKTELMSKGKSFRFRDNSTEANHFEPYPNEQDPSGTVDAWRHQPTQSTAWKTTKGGSYEISLNTVTEKVTFTSTQQVITITGGPSALAPGENGTFTATATITDEKHPIVWKVYGDEDAHTNNLANAGTSIGTDGTLTVGSGDWITHTLYVTAESLGEAVTFEQYPVLKVPIIDPAVYIVGFMNEWANAGTAMTRGSTDDTKHLFTWTGALSNDRDFRMHRGGGSEWSRFWFAPNSDGTYGINSGHHENIAVARWENAEETGRKWQITSWGDGGYTITFNAAARTLDVTKD